MLTNDYVPGAPDWIDLGSRDTTAAAAYYGSLFGWEFEPGGPASGGYGTFVRDGATVAALGPLQDTGAHPAWTVYFETADADATTAAVEENGGTVRVPPMDVFDQGRLASYTDPTGGEFGVWQPGTNKGLDHVGPWGLCWTELYTPRAQRAKDFYAAVLAWDYEDMPLPGDASADVYTVVSRSGGGQDGSHGGILQLGPDLLPTGTAYWQPYFGVDDCDAVVARATEGGGTALLPPTDMAGVGRLALLTDPEGAFFAVLTPAASMTS
ncbi:VOC family protein [Streptomyces sp. NPDC008317]|uniref:VOC family protein n=1 Tax=unclassified Streptomyces TaxID=2593676 RepID=UPI0036F17B7B